MKKLFFCFFAVLFCINIFANGEEDWKTKYDALLKDIKNVIDRYNPEQPKSTVQSGVNINQGLLAYWSFNDGFSGAQLKDDSGNNVFCTVNGGPKLVDGVFGRAMEFDGKDDFLNITKPMNFGGTMSFSLWFNVTEFQSWQRLIDFGSGAVKDNILLNFEGESGRIRSSVFSDTWESAAYTTRQFVGKNIWYHVVLIEDITTSKIFINGKLVAFSAENYVIPSVVRDKLYIGKSNWGDPNFKGKMDEIRVYKRAINEFEILELYNQGKTKVPVNIAAGKSSDSTDDPRFGKLRFLTDGIYAPEHWGWDNKNFAVCLNNKYASFTIDLGNTYSGINYVAIQADSNDIYIVEYSDDGNSWNLLYEFKQYGGGLTTRYSGKLQNSVSARYIRISTSEGDDSRSVSEIQIYAIPD